MRKLNLFLVLVVVTIFSLTSCQKDALEENNIESAIIQENIDGPPSLMEKSEGEVEDFSNELLEKLLKIEKEEVIKIEDQATSRNGEDEIIIQGISIGTKVELTCGARLVSSNNSNHNNFTDYFYGSRGYGTNLNGGDNIYYFDATQDMRVTFSLRTQGYNRENLAMFMFEGDYDDRNHVARVRQHVAHSSSTSRYSEELRDVSVRRGRRYILVVDSAPNRGCDYNISVTCSNGGGGNPQPTTCDNFESYRLDYLTPQNPSKYERWDYNSKDGQIVRGSSNLLYMARDPYSGASTQADVIFKTGRYRTGHRTLSMNMWIYRGRSGYFNIQKRLRQEYGAEIYFHDGGYGELRIGSQAYNFNYPQSTWFTVEMDFDFNSGRANLKIDNRVVRSWPIRYNANATNGSSQIEGVDFYVPKSDSEFYIDNLCFG